MSLDNTYLYLVPLVYHLFGVAVLNGVVMVESINQRVAQAIAKIKRYLKALFHGSDPYSMTALTSMLGLIPMLLSTGIGAEIQKPCYWLLLAVCHATFLTLFVLVLYKSMSK